MDNSKLYSAHDIEKLKLKVATYKDTLTTLKAGNSIDDYLFMKKEFNSFKTKISNFERMMDKMDEKQNMQREGYEQQVEEFLTQINSLNQTVGELNHDVSLIHNQIKSNEFEEVTNPSTNLVDSLNDSKKETKGEVDLLNEESINTKEQITISSIGNSNLPPSYKQLQKFINDAKNIQELPTNIAPTISTVSQKNNEEGQQLTSKQNFPSNSSKPSQTYKGLYGNVKMKSKINSNKSVLTHTVSMNVKKDETKPFFSANSTSEEIENAPEYLNKPPTLTPIKENEEISTFSSEDTDQEIQNKEASSFFKFFRKKN